MEAKKLYDKLEEDFITPEMEDDWAPHMEEVQDYLSENYKKRSMGLVCDNSESINKVYTAVFPSKKVMEKILLEGAEDAMLFVHHPSIWDIRNAPKVFSQMDRNLLEKFKEKRISIYNLHVPLDNHGEYSTSKTLADALGVEYEKSFAPYFKALCGMIGKTELKTIQELSEKYTEVIGHKTSLYNYGKDEIKNQRVALIAGGANDIEFLQQIVDEGVNTFVTGITAKNSHSQKAHDFAKEHKINVLGGTHYSTEKFACIAMCDYFKKLGLESKFIEDEPVMEDM